MTATLVDVENLRYSHRQGTHEQQILHDLTLQLNPGEVVVLTGPSGSGKSTLLTIIGGLRRAHEGRVTILGESVIGARERTLVKVRRQIGFIFQQHNLAPALTVAQNIQMGLQLSGGHRGPQARQRIEAAAESVGLADQLGKMPNQLSGGQQQRVGIARALVNQPGLVLADEPTASLDRESGQLVMDIFDRLAETGSAVVLVTHDKRIIDQADRILMMDEGRLIPPADRLVVEITANMRSLRVVGPERIGRLLSLGHALARVALADGRLDDSERGAMVAALQARQLLPTADIELVVDLALAQAQAWSSMPVSPDLVEALERVAAADDVVTDAERQIIDELMRPPPGSA
jgi:putative ABC transport system ATP-binding protein